jgi:DNA-binding response OmpR family regulator
MRILVVEDDPALRLGVRRALQAEGWQIDTVEDGEAALTAARLHSFDAAVLDLGLPRIDGLSVLKNWRASGQDLSVLILTAHDDLQDRLEGFNLGADDYLGKPFEPEELVARLRALFRRRIGLKTSIFRMGQCTFTPATREFLYNGETLPLSPRESALIELLMAFPAKTVTKNKIISSMSSWDADFTSNSVEIYIMRLRRKIVNKGLKIETIRGIGYRLCLEEVG